MTKEKAPSQGNSLRQKVDLKWKWSFPNKKWLEVEKILCGGTGFGLIFKPWIEDTIRIYLLICKKNRKKSSNYSDRDDAEAIQDALETISKLSKAIYGVKEIANSTKIRGNISRIVESRHTAELEDKKPPSKAPLGSLLLHPLIDIQTVLQDTLQTIQNESHFFGGKHTTVASIEDALREARNNILLSSVLAYQLSYGKIPTPQAEDRGGRFQTFIKLVINTATDEAKMDRYKWGTLRSQITKLIAQQVHTKTDKPNLKNKSSSLGSRKLN